MMDPQVSAMLRRQAEEVMLIVQDRSHITAERGPLTFEGWVQYGVDAGLFDLSTFDGWLDHGIAAGFCGEGVCGMHDGTPFTADEAELFEAGEDPCVPMVRVFPGGPGG